MYQILCTPQFHQCSFEIKPNEIQEKLKHSLRIYNITCGFSSTSFPRPSANLSVNHRLKLSISLSAAPALRRWWLVLPFPSLEDLELVLLASRNQNMKAKMFQASSNYINNPICQLRLSWRDKDFLIFVTISLTLWHLQIMKWL